MLAVEKHVPENLSTLYIKQWLEAQLVTKSGKLTHRKGNATRPSNQPLAGKSFSALCF
jgi:hypothetical protein